MIGLEARPAGLGVRCDLVVESSYERWLRAELSALLDRPDSPVAPLLDRDALREQLAEPIGHRSGLGARFQLEQILNLHAWCTDYRVTLDL